MSYWRTLRIFSLLALLLCASAAHAAEIPLHPQGLDEIKQMRTVLDGYRQSALQSGQYDAALHADITRQLDALTISLRSKLESRYALPKDAADVRKYLPADAVLDGSVDYSAQIQKALDENPVVILTGSGDAKKPAIYGVKTAEGSPTALNVPAGHILLGSPDAILRRIPSRGRTVIVGNGGMVMGLIIDGNKNAHWPEFQNLGKIQGSGIILTNDAAAIGCTIYDLPGIAFATYSHRNVFWKNVARNVGYIDLKYNATFYQGRWDNDSGDGFYVRGYGNLVLDCEAYDCFRWGYTTCHENSGTTTYINSTMHNTLYRTYGFIDLEDCKHDPIGTMVINMRATQGSLTVAGTNNAMLFNSESGSFVGWNANDLFVAGSRTHGGGMGIGGWTSARNAQVRGGNNPVYLGNTVVKATASSGIPSISDWSLSIFSSDGKGLAAGNVLKEYEGPAGKGTGLQLDQVTHANNTVEYGSWIESTSGNTEERINATDAIRTRAMRTFNAQIADIAGSLGAKGNITRVIFPRPQAQFIQDKANVGEKEAWFKPENKPADDKLKPIFFGEHWDPQHGYYEGHAWYFTTFQITEDDFHGCDQVYLLLSGVDTESKVYINGQQVGITNVWNKPFLLEIPRATQGPIKWDENLLNNLTIHVFSPQGMGGVYGQVALVLSSGKEPMGKAAGAAVPAGDAKPVSTARPAVASPKGISADLTQVRAIRQFETNKKVWARDGIGAELRAEGAFLSREVAGPGLYRVTFTVDESDPKFQYHVPQFLFLFPDAEKVRGTTALRDLGQAYYGLTWFPSGEIRLFRFDPETRKEAVLAKWQKPGPTSPAKYTKDAPARLIVELPPAGGQIKLYFGADEPRAQPDATLLLPGDAPAAGSFGFHNPKWFSTVTVKELHFTPAGK